uniref:Uncharacterized protein n=1 Tax=Oryza glaberrima TaxID=4538 RepID=I1R0E7_ORYGL
MRRRRGVVHLKAERRELQRQMQELVEVALRREWHRHNGDRLELGGGATMSGASIRVMQLENRFPFGSCINKTASQNPNIVDFFCDNFDWAVCWK